MDDQGASRRRRWIAFLVAAPGLALAIAFAGVAYACTTIMGPLQLTPTSGPGGTRVATSAQGLVAGGTYQIHFGKTTSDSCMSFKNVLTLATVIADSSGGWQNVMVTIPNTASRGVHSACAMETRPVKGGSGTTHNTFTVT